MKEKLQKIGCGITWLILLFSPFVAIALLPNSCSKTDLTDWKAANDSLRRELNKTSTTTIQNAEIAKELKELRGIIDKKTLTATVITTRTVIDTAGKPFILPDADPIIIELPDGTREIHHYHTLTKVFDNQWYNADIKADTKAISLKLTIRDSLTVRHQLKNTGFLGLGKQRLDIEVFNHNPYSTTTGLKSFYQSVKRRRFGIGIGIYGGVNQHLSPSIFIGGGLQYNLITF